MNREIQRRYSRTETAVAPDVAKMTRLWSLKVVTRGPSVPGFRLPGLGGVASSAWLQLHPYIRAEWAGHALSSQEALRRTVGQTDNAGDGPPSN